MEFSREIKLTSIGSIVVSENGSSVILLESLNGSEEGSDDLGILDVGRSGSNLLEDLSERRSSEPLLSSSEIDEDENGRSKIGSELRSPGEGDVLDGSEGGDDDRDGRGDFSSVSSLVVPLHLHGHGVLSDGDSDSESGAELHSDGLDGFVETSGLSRVGSGGHPEKERRGRGGKTRQSRVSSIESDKREPREGEEFK